MAVLRDVVARLTLTVDKRGFQEADREIQTTTDALKKLGAAATAAFAGLSIGIGFAVKAAADANETLNLMRITFREGADDVIAWADTFAEQAGRSVFELREMATQLGSVINPLLGDNIELATEFAQALSERAVDFASARNISDLRATNAFISGLTGETEPLKRFGIILTEASLNAFALEEGIGKTTKQMDEAEKTQLRYNFLMARTAAFQGDAANTSEAFTNATKALRSNLIDLSIRIGQKFLPGAERIIRVARDVAATLGQWVEQSKIVESALLVLGAIATAVAIRMGVAWALLNLQFILFAVAVFVAVAVLDDFLTFMDGGRSVIGRFIDSIFGPGSAVEAVDALKEAGEGLILFWKQELRPGIKEITDFLSESFSDAFEAVTDFVIENQMALLQWSNGVKEIFSGVADFLDISLPDPSTNVPTTTRRGIGAPLEGAAARDIRRASDIATNDSSQTSNVINQTVNVTVPAGTQETEAQRTADATASAMERMNRRTRAAITQRLSTVIR